MTSEKSVTRPDELESDQIITRSFGATRARNESGNQLIQIELGLGKSAIVILWFSALVSGLAVAGLIATMLFIRANIGYTAVLEYDLMDLRAKTGYAHENTPDPVEEE